MDGVKNLFDVFEVCNFKSLLLTIFLKYKINGKMIKHGEKYLEKRILVEDNQIIFNTGYTKNHFIFFIFLTFFLSLSMVCIYIFIIYTSDIHGVAMILLWVVFSLYVIHIPLFPVVEMLFRNKIFVDYNNNELLIRNIFDKEKTKKFRNNKSIKYEQKIYFYYQSFYYKIFLKYRDGKLTIIDGISSKKEALSLCNHLQSFNNNI